MMHDFITKIKQAIDEQALMPEGSAWIIGVSGGADSVALLHAVAALQPKYGWTLWVGHVHHGLRPSADRDQAFVKTLAENLGLGFVTEKVDVSSSAWSGSVEMRCRQARRACFKKWAEQHQAAGVVFAHHMNDQAETLILRLCRGSSLTGLSAMRPRAALNDTLEVVRPMLGLQRKEVIGFLEQTKKLWVEDESNAESVFARNKVRHSTIPSLEKINEAAVANIARTADWVGLEERYLDELAQRCLADVEDDGVFSLSAFDAVPEALQFRVMDTWLCQQGYTQVFSSAQWLALLTFLKNRDGNSMFRLEQGAYLLRAYQLLHFGQEETDQLEPARPPVEGAGGLIPPRDGALLSSVEGSASADPKKTAEVRLSISSDGPTSFYYAPLNATVVIEEVDSFSLPEQKEIGRFPQEVIIQASGKDLCLRPWQAGDRVAPLGMEGSKKIQDVYTDEKVPSQLRERWPVLVSGDEVLWVPGYQVARSSAVREEQKGPFLKISLLG